MFCGAYSGEEDDLSNSKGHRNTQPNLGERLTNISSEIKVKKKKKEEWDKSNNNNSLKTARTAKQKIELKDTEKYGQKII